MKKVLLILFALLPIMASAYDIAVKNADGVTIYYNYSDDGQRLQVAKGGRYSGDVKIPEEVTYLNRTRKVTSIETGAFQSTPLTSITIPGTITSIPEMAFNRCTSLTSVNISNGVTSIKNYAFSSCLSLTDIFLPNSVTSIGDNVFKDCWKLNNVSIPSTIESISNKTFDSYYRPPVSIRVLDFAAFCNNKIVSKIYEAVNSISLTDEWGNRTNNYVIPDGVKSIGDYAFAKCRMDSITFPNSVLYIETAAFYGCNKLTSVELPGVTFIGNQAFYGCTSLTSVTMSSVTSIGKYAFYECTGLTSVAMSSVTSIGNQAFYGCTLLEKVSLSSTGTVKIGERSFYNCKALKKVELPNTVKSIGNQAFYGCTNLFSIVIPSTITSMGENVFYDYLQILYIRVIDLAAFCDNKITCKLERNITLIDEQGRAITHYIIPDGVKYISYSAFKNCKGLTKIVIPNSIKEIDGAAFSGCNKLLKIYSKIDNPFSILENVFDKDVFMNAELFVPLGTKPRYTGTKGWKNFVFITESEEMTPIYPVINNLVQKGDIFNLSGQRVDNPKPGIYIQGGRKVVIK